MKRGKRNAITDVPGVKVGHTTLDHQSQDNDYVCTGVTAILPIVQYFRTKSIGSEFRVKRLR